MELRLRLAAQRRGFSAELAEAINGDRYMHLLERLHAGVPLRPALPGRPDTAEVGSHAPTPTIWPVMSFRRWCGGPGSGCGERCAGPAGKPSDTQLHRIRIASKQLRYAAEAAEPVIGKAARRTARRAKDLQTVLGDHHDAVTAEEWLQGVALDGTGVGRFRRRPARLRDPAPATRAPSRLEKRLGLPWPPPVDPLAAVTG